MNVRLAWYGDLVTDLKGIFGRPRENYGVGIRIVDQLYTSWISSQREIQVLWEALIYFSSSGALIHHHLLAALSETHNA